MEFRNTQVSAELVPEGVSQLYQGHVVKSDAVSTEALAGRIAERLKVDVSVARNVVAAFAAEIDDAIRNGERPVFDGVFTTRFVVSGAFDSEDDAWDASRNSVGLAFVTLDPVKGSVAAIVPTNVLGKVQVQLLGAQDATTYEQNTLTVGHTLLCQGRNLRLTAANADEGLFLVKGSTGTEYKATVTANTSGTIDATFAATLPAGDDYALVVRGRGGNGVNRSLVTAKIGGFVVKAA